MRNCTVDLAAGHSFTTRTLTHPSPLPHTDMAAPAVAFEIDTSDLRVPSPKGAALDLQVRLVAPQSSCLCVEKAHTILHGSSLALRFFVVLLQARLAAWSPKGVGKDAIALAEAASGRKQAQLAAKQEALSAKHERVRDVASRQKQSLLDMTNTSLATAEGKVKKVRVQRKGEDAQQQHSSVSKSSSSSSSSKSSSKSSSRKCKRSRSWSSSANWCACEPTLQPTLTRGSARRPRRIATASSVPRSSERRSTSPTRLRSAQ